MIAISVIGLFVLVVVGIGGVVLVTLIAALAGSKSRSAGPILVGLLLLPLGIVCLLGVGAYFTFYQREAAQQARAQAEANYARAAARSEQLARESADGHLAHPRVEPPRPTYEEGTTSEIPVELPTADEATAESSEPPVADEPVDEAEPAPDAVETQPTEDSPADEVAAVEDDASVALIPANKDRPAWVDREEPFKDGSVYKWPLELELAVDRAEAEQKYLAGAVNEAIRRYIPSRLRLESRAADVVHLPHDYIVENVIVDTWAEPVQASTGDFVKLHVLLEFDRETNRLIEERWAQHVAAQRLWTAGGLLGVGLLVLASAFAYLRVDLATEGKYRGRLRIVAAAAILAVALAGLAALA